MAARPGSTAAPPAAPRVQHSAGKMLFLINGRVRMDSTAVGGGSIQSDQTRLVWADNDEQAVQKFMKHFTDMTTSDSVYTVIGASISEAIQ